MVGTYPHDATAFTEGLEWRNGRLYEGTGLRGRSTLRRTNPATGEVEQRVSLPPPFFGEGITVLDGCVYQLTWRSRVGFVYDEATFRLLGTFEYASEGWGLTNDGTRLIMSDGTQTIRFLDPETLMVTDSVEIDDAGAPVVGLNELEYVEGRLFANLFKTDYIAEIDLSTGTVTGWIDLSALAPPDFKRRRGSVPNGIACLPESGHLLVTGKRWPAIFEIDLPALHR